MKKIVALILILNSFLFSQTNLRFGVNSDFFDIGLEQKIEVMTSYNFFNEIYLLNSKIDNKNRSIYGLTLSSYHPNEDGLFAIKMGVVGGDDSFVAFPIILKYDKFFPIIPDLIDSFVGIELSYASDFLVVSDASEFLMGKVYLGIPISSTISFDINYYMVDTNYINKDIDFADTLSFGLNISF